VAIVCLPIFFTGNLISRREGFLFIFYYIAYTIYLILASTQHDSLPLFSTAMLVVVLLTIVTLAFLTWRAYHTKPRPREEG
jgi:cation:H+ antiporter